MRFGFVLSVFLAAVALLGGCGKSEPAAPKTPTTGPSTSPATPGASGHLLVLCGSSMAEPIQEIGKAFAAKTGAQIEYDLGGSETLLPKILVGTRADVFVCHDPFEEKVRVADKLEGSVAVGWLEPVLAVRPGNPKGIQGIADLAKPDLRIGIGDPRYSTCGEMFVKMLEARGLKDAVMKNVSLQARSHAEVANGMLIGPLDAIVVWNFVAVTYKGKIELVPTDATYDPVRVTVLGLSEAQNPGLRDQFRKFCAQPENVAIFEKAGYGKGPTTRAR